MEQKGMPAVDLLKLEQIIMLNNEFVQVANKARKKIPIGEYPILEFVFISFFHRFVDAIDSTNTLLQHYAKNRNVETGIGLIFRASLLDFLIIIYLGTYENEVDESKPETQKKFDEALESFICDQLKFSIQHIDLAYQAKVINYEDYSKGLENFYNSYKPFFTHFEKKNLSRCLKGKRFSIKDIFHRIHQDKTFKHLSAIYDYYTFYSKYDHFGIMTNSMQNMSINEEFGRIRLTYDYLYQGAISSLLKIAENKLDLLTIAYDLQGIYKRFIPLAKFPQ